MSRVARRVVSAVAITGLTTSLGALAIPKAIATPDIEEVSYLGGSVQTLGEAKFADTFTGAVTADDGSSIRIYTTDPDGTTFQADVAGLNVGGVAIEYVRATRSLDELDALSSAVLGASSQLEKAGLNLSLWSPDPATSTVEITLLQPTSTDLSNLTAYESRYNTNGTTEVTAANYTTAADSAVRDLLGSGYTVSPSLQSKLAVLGTSDSVQPDAGSSAGVSPFAGGDLIQRVGTSQKCTGGFAVKGNASGNPFMLTAGHCGSGTWETPAEVMGQTGSVYYNNSGEDDFQTINIQSGRGAVNGDSAQYSVTGAFSPNLDDLITIDGYQTGEKHDQKVVHTDATVMLLDNKTGLIVPVSHVVVSVGSCLLGDSGGPAYQRQDPSHVKAVGTIVGFSTSAPRCFEERIGREESVSNTSLILNKSVVSR